jgi:hypothetical protein
MSRTLRLALSILLLPAGLAAQEHVHTPGMTHEASNEGAVPTAAGQDAFAAIAEVVRILEADSTTNWRTVDLERLRQHLIDMNEVTLRAVVTQTPVDGGARFLVEGEGRTRDAIRRMATAHAATVSGPAGPRVTIEQTARGVSLTIIAANPADAGAAARIRGLGFIGFLTLGDHHGPHHLAMARGRGH